MWQMRLLDHEHKIWFGTARSNKKTDFHFNHQEFSGFLDGRAPDVYNDGGSFPDADPPSKSEDDFGDKRTAAETYINNKDKMFSF
jgi:hypothetical protein